MLLKQAYDNLVSENNNVVSVNKEPNDSDSSDQLLKSLASDYLCKVSPAIGREFIRQYSPGSAKNVSLEDVVFHYQKTGPRKRKLLENVDFGAKKIKLEPVDFESETHEYVECEESKDVKVKLEPKFEPVKDEYEEIEDAKDVKVRLEPKYKPPVKSERGNHKKSIAEMLAESLSSMKSIKSEQRIKLKRSIKEKIKIEPNLESVPEDTFKKAVQIKRGTKARHPIEKFSTEEDQILLEKYREGISTNQIAKDLQRPYRSITVRLEKLLTIGPERKPIPFTLNEDLIIIDYVLENIQDKKSLRECYVVNSSSLSSTIGRPFKNIQYRWEFTLKVWLLSYFNKCLGLEIRPMLANFLVDNFKSIDDIEWSKVKQFPEFAGHTERSLRQVLLTSMINRVNKFLKVESSEITLQQIGTYFNSDKFKPQKWKRVEERQMKIISYFEECLKKRNIALEDLDLT